MTKDHQGKGQDGRRDERRAAALRANLRRRKGQARESAQAADGVSTGDGAADGEPGDQRLASDPAA